MNRFIEKSGRAGRLAVVALAVIAVGWLTLTFTADSNAAPPQDREAISHARDLGKAFTSVSKRVIPAVVTINSNKVIHTAGRFHGGNEEFEDFFGRFFGVPPGDSEGGEVRQRALGSGVIVSDDGYIITNNHVVADAEEISVVLSEGDEFDAKVVGADEKTDIAVIKIDGKNLPAADLGDSDDLEVGEWVLAIGSPFSQELGATVTAGIVSGKSRGLGLANYEDFIQTDAAINPGNSGGALVNLDGEVVGINTAIATRSGGSQGVGFAIPISMVNRIKDDLIEDGKVTRGWIGIAIQPITREFQEAFDLPDRNGVLVSRVEPGSPAEDAGLRQRDVIRFLDGKSIDSFREFRIQVASMTPGTRIDLGIQRDGDEKTLHVALGTFPDDEVAVASADVGDLDKLGFEVGTITAERQREFGLEQTEGVVVVDVQRGSVAAQNDIRPGDVILEANRVEVGSVQDFRRAMSDVKAREVVLFLLERDGATRFVALRMPK